MYWVGRLILVLVLCAGVTMLSLALGPRIQTALAVRRLSSSDPGVRKQGLRYVRDQREATATLQVLERLELETDPAMVELAGYAAMRTRDRRGVGALQARADREADSELKGHLILYAARLSGGDYRLLDWLLLGAQAPEPWRRAASCVGLLQMGRLEGGSLLLSTQASLPPAPREFALDEFRRISEPMAETIGRPMGLPERLSDSMADRAWSDLGSFWGCCASLELLADTLARLGRDDPKWREVDRLLHARERVSRWIH